MPTTDLNRVAPAILQPSHGLGMAKDSKRVGHLCDVGQDMGWGLNSVVRFALYKRTNV